MSARRIEKIKIITSPFTRNLLPYQNNIVAFISGSLIGHTFASIAQYFACFISQFKTINREFASALATLDLQGNRAEEVL